MNWAKQSKWSLVPLNTPNTPWAGGSVWPFAAQHLSTTVSVSSLSFNLSLSHPSSTVQRLSLLHYTMRATFFVAVFSLAYRFVQVQADTRMLWHAHSAHIYTRIITAWHASLLSHSVLSWGERLGFSLSWWAAWAQEEEKGRKRGGWTNFTVPLLYLLAVWIHRGPCKQTRSALFNWAISLICIQESKLYSSGK